MLPAFVRQSVFGLVAATCGAAELADPKKLPPSAGGFDFDRDVRAVLETSCLHCHNAEKDKGGLRLDTRDFALKGGDEHRAFVPGKAAESAALHFAARLVDEMEMPPKGKGDPLTTQQIGRLRAWVEAGAPWPDGVTLTAKNPVVVDAREKIPPFKDPAKLAHWAFKAPVRPGEPKITKPEWVRSPVDSFVLARLEAEHLSPSPEADRITLCRRLYLDLIGLPPKPEEVDAFVKDPSADAYAKLVEKLLASPHYGERWGRHWLDAARYADSDGYEKDKPRIAHFYRDWVIGAFNRDLPYDQFVIEQIAGDLLPNPTQDQIVATGFLRNSLLNEEGGVDPEQFRMEAMFDRMDCVGKAVLGLTLSCTQCHDHKFDPFSHEDYYRIFAFLNNDHESQPRVYSAEDWKGRATVQRGITEIEAELKHANPDWEQRMSAWEDAWRAKEKPEWKVVKLDVDKNVTGGQAYLPMPDDSLLTAGFQPTKSTCVASLRTDLRGITGFRIETLHDPNLPAQGPGRSHLGTFGLSEFNVETQVDGKAVPVKFAKATADLAAPVDTPVNPAFNEKQPVKRVMGPASYAIDGNKDTSWSADLGPGRRNLESTAVFAAEKPINSDAPAELTLRLVQNMGGWNADDLHAAQLGRFRVSVTTSPAPEADSVPPHIAAALGVPRAQRSAAQVATIFSHWRGTVPKWKEANARIEALWATHPEGVTQFTLTQRENTRETHLLKRGDWLKPADLMKPGVPKALHPLPANADGSRLTLACWLVDRKSPTTARALVNRMWQTYFGTGLLASPEDFGLQAEKPSHPELLDWLAVEFMDRGWSIKALHRLIVNSATYRQASNVSPELLAKDPYNRLLARGARLRVEAEVVRDVQLAAAGIRNPKVGGPALMPPAPVFLFQPPASYAPFPWVEEKGADRYRRSVYTWRRRTTPYPFLQIFDAPEGNTSCVRRMRSNTPLQALTTLNETVSMEAAQGLAARMLEASTDAERVALGFRRVASRPPTDAEARELLAFLNRAKSRVADHSIDPAQIAPAKPEAAAYTALARVILNLDEALTKE
jgi:hypothetical protein